MKKRTKIILLVAVSGIAFSAIACGRHHGHHARHAEHAQKYVTHRVDRMLSKVDATDKQRTEVHRVKDHIFSEMKTAHAGSEGAKRLLLEQWKAEKPDAKKLHALADERTAAYNKAAHEMVDGLLEVHGTLDAKQRRIVAEHIEEHLAD